MLEEQNTVGKLLNTWKTAIYFEKILDVTWTQEPAYNTASLALCFW